MTIRPNEKQCVEMWEKSISPAEYEDMYDKFMITPFIDSQVIKPEVKDKVKVLGHWFHITEVREKDVMIRRDGIYGGSVLIFTDMLHIVIYKPDPIAKKSFYWLATEMI